MSLAGQVLGDRYSIKEVLSDKGASSVVYLARDQRLGSMVAIKVLRPNAAEYFKKKFPDGIESLSRINHPGVVRGFDRGDTPEGEPYLVMEYVGKCDLKSQIAHNGLPLKRVANIIRQLGHAVEAAHNQGIWHRDLKPQNIMLQEAGGVDEVVKIIDFGIATIKDSQETLVSVVTNVGGTLPYMAPEQLKRKPSAQSDIYALGVIAYEMVTGRVPFEAKTQVELYDMQRGMMMKDPGTLRLDLPEAAQEVILGALSFDSEERRKRYPKASDFSDTLAVHLTTPQESRPPYPELEMAYVVCLGFVGFLDLPINQQGEHRQKLQKIVSERFEVQRVDASGQLITQDTLDGMALMFFEKPVWAVTCAMDIARAFLDYPDKKLRIGVHSELVYRVEDTIANKKIPVGGVNTAHRVMSYGEAAHILLSKTVADGLIQHSDWRRNLRDLGEYKDEHGVALHLFNLCTDEVGNPKAPEKPRRPGKYWPIARRLAAALVVLLGVMYLFFKIDKAGNTQSPTVTQESKQMVSAPTPETPSRNATGNAGPSQPGIAKNKSQTPVPTITPDPSKSRLLGPPSEKEVINLVREMFEPENVKFTPVGEMTPDGEGYQQRIKVTLKESSTNKTDTFKTVKFIWDGKKKQWQLAPDSK